MDNNNSMFFEKIQGSLIRLKVLLEGSERFVNQFYENTRDLLSEKDKKSESETKSVITNYKNTFDKINGKFEKLKVKELREKCQIFMYGKVSAGKSKIINAMLGEEIFQSAPNHTTSCFVKIRKSPDQQHHIVYKNRKNSYYTLIDLKQKIRDLSTAVSQGQNQLKTDELLTVYLNILDNKFLTSSTEIMDCPGSENREFTTNCIKDNGLNADVFILVTTSGITEDEKKFFQYQLENSSKPIIFFLVNKWDQASNDGDEIAANSKSKITKELFEFHKNRIKLADVDLGNRIFFISALNICKKRNIGYGTSSVSDHHDEESRQFENFEKSLAQFIKTFIDEGSKYKKELEQLNENIIKKTNQFQTDLKKKIYIVNMQEFEKYLIDIRKSSEYQLKKINDAKDKRLTNNNEIKAFIDECERNIEYYNNELVKTEFQNLINKNESPILKLKNEVDDFISKEIDKYELLTGIILRKKNVKITDLMRTEIQFEDVTLWERFISFLYELFHYEKNSDTNISSKEQKFRNNKKKIESAALELEKEVSRNVTILIEYLEADIKKIINSLQLKITSCKEYSKNIEKLFN